LVNLIRKVEEESHLEGEHSGGKQFPSETVSAATSPGQQFWTEILRTHSILQERIVEIRHVFFLFFVFLSRFFNK